MPELDIFAEANRQLTICNACRYCEGLCPVFPAMEIRKSFAPEDIRYLANLCHDCRACQQACMFTEPHEFAINFPKMMSKARLESYEHWSWPGILAKSFSATPKGVVLGVVAGLAVCTSALLAIPSERLFAVHRGPGAFYEVIGYLAMIIPALCLVVYGAAIWLRGAIRFWGYGDSAPRGRAHGLTPVLRAIRDAANVKYLGGGGPGCAYPDKAPSQIRRIYHALVFWGFLADLVSTTLAFLYQDLFHFLPPYPLVSLPVLFGAGGGVALVVGTTGLLVLKWKSDRTLAADRAYGLDYAFLIFLDLAGLTGLLTLMLRATPGMGLILVIHLSAVAALFITAPYGKFVHFVYRTLALVRFQVEAQGASPQGGH